MRLEEKKSERKVKIYCQIWGKKKSNGCSQSQGLAAFEGSLHGSEIWRKKQFGEEII